MRTRIGRTRIKLAEILCRDLKVECFPEDLHPAGGRARNRTSTYDMYAWEVYCHKQGVPFVAGSFDTMTECVKVGRVGISDGEIFADYS